MNKYQRGWKTRRKNLRQYNNKQFKRRLLIWLTYIAMVSVIVFGIAGGVLSAKDTNITENNATPQIEPIAENIVEIEIVPPAPVKTLRDVVLELTRDAGIEDWKIETLLKCENINWDPNAYYVNKSGSYEHTVDRGLFMINDHFHPKLSNEQAFDPIENTKYAIHLYQKTNSFQLWSCGKKFNI